MPQIIENTPLIEQRHALIKRRDKREITDDQFEKLVEPIETKIAENTLTHLKQYNSKIRSERPNLQNKTKNEIKRIVGEYLKTLLEDLDDNTKKGIFRYGYKSLKGSDDDD